MAYAVRVYGTIFGKELEEKDRVFLGEYYSPALDSISADFEACFNLPVKYPDNMMPKGEPRKLQQDVAACPFCGFYPKVKNVERDGLKGFSVICKCGINSGDTPIYRTIEEAIDKYNARENCKDSTCCPFCGVPGDKEYKEIRSYSHPKIVYSCTNSECFIRPCTKVMPYNDAVNKWKHRHEPRVINSIEEFQQVLDFISHKMKYLLSFIQYGYPHISKHDPKYRRFDAEQFIRRRMQITSAIRELQEEQNLLIDAYANNWPKEFDELKIPKKNMGEWY